MGDFTFLGWDSNSSINNVSDTYSTHTITVINKLLSELETTLIRFKRDLQDPVTRGRYYRKFIEFNRYGQDTFYEVETDKGIVYVNVTELQDARDLMKLKYPELQILTIKPKACLTVQTNLIKHTESKRSI